MRGRGCGSDEGVLPSGDLALYIGIPAAADDGSTCAFASSSSTEVRFSDLAKIMMDLWRCQDGYFPISLG